jgi:four helix bundle protein
LKDNQLITLSKIFAVDIVNTCNEIREQRKGNALVNQLLKSGTSIGANIHEANYASSRNDFICKLQISLKECYETEYWLDLFKETNMISVMNFNRLISQCYKIRRILSASIRTAKHNSPVAQE